MRQLIGDLLRKEGLEVEEIADGEQLLLRAIEASFPRHGAARMDLLVSDVRMPFFSGLDVVAKIRAAGRDLPVILITAFGDATVRQRARELQATLLDKPFTPHVLRAAVRELLARVSQP